MTKLLEKEVQSQFLFYLKKHNFINIDQYAFLPNHSTTTCLHNILDDWYDSFNEREMVGVCFLDISKCFDCIDNNILLKKKMERYGVKNNELLWFTNYLSGRKQTVYCHEKLSKFNKLSVGIPQGSALGPLIFLVFINDLSECLLSCSCNIYADDVVIYISEKSDEAITSTLQADLENISKWYKRNKLKVNVDKTYSMLLKRNPLTSQEVNIYLDGYIIKQVKHIRYLGIEIDENLTWNSQVKNLSKSLAFKLFSLKKVSQFTDTKVLNKIYNCTIQPILDYSCSVWGNCSVNNKNILLRLHKRAARIVEKNFDYTESGIDIIKRLKWQVLEKRRNYFLACIMYNCIHGHAPVSLCNSIDMVFDRHPMNT